MPVEHSMGAVIVNKGNYLLLYRKAHGIYHEGWFFVRGMTEGVEETEDTVRREVREETGIDDLFFVKGFKEQTKWFYRKDGQLVFKTAVYLLAETSTEKITLSEEHDGFSWLPFADAIVLLKFKNDKEVLRKANDFMEIAKKV